MSNNRKPLYIGAGWNKVSKEGNKFISAQGGNKKLKLVAIDLETGEEHEVKYFSIFKNNSEDRKEKSPDYNMVFFPQDEA